MSDRFPSHGTQTRATTYGCHCTPCRTAQTRYVKQWRLARSRGVQFTVPTEPSRRKIQALEAIGHTRTSVAAEMGLSVAAVTNMLAKDLIRARSEVRVEQAYRRMEMRIPPDTRESRRARARAAKNGWPPPLAYDDIHAGILAQMDPEPGIRNRFDEEAVDFALQYQDFTDLSKAEKFEVVRRWKASGRSEASLCRLTGWREGRYSSETTHQEAS